MTNKVCSLAKKVNLTLWSSPRKQFLKETLCSTQRVRCILPPPETLLLATAISSGRRKVFGLGCGQLFPVLTHWSHTQLTLCFCLARPRKMLNTKHLPCTCSLLPGHVYTGAAKLC